MLCYRIVLGRQSVWLILLIPVSCSTRSVVDSDASGGSAGSAGVAGSAGGSAGLGATGGGAGTEAGAGTGGTSGAGGTTSVKITIAADDDDVMWRWSPSTGWAELKEAASHNNVLYISQDVGKDERVVGVRFKLDIPADAQLQSAALQIFGTPSQNNGMKAGDTLEVRRFEPDAPFKPGDPQHFHGPTDHGSFASGGVVFGIEQIGNIDVKQLVQPALASSAGFQPGDYVSFSVAAKNAGTRRFTAGDKGKDSHPPAELRITYSP